VEPIKFASMEALYDGKDNAGLTVIGIVSETGEKIGEKSRYDVKMKIQIPNMLSLMTTGKGEGFVPGIKDFIYGNPSKKILSVSEMIERGKYARKVLTDYKMSKEIGDKETAAALAAKFSDRDFVDNYFSYFGYSYFSAPWQVIPSVPVIFYSFRIMVGLGFFFILLCAVALWLYKRDKLVKNRWFLWVALLSIPLSYIASEMGWIVCEMGRQPWIIQNLMPVNVAVSNITSSSVQVTFFLFALLFTGLLVAEVSIMVRQIKNGPKHKED